MEEYTNSETSKDEQPSMTLENEGGTEQQLIPEDNEQMETTKDDIGDDSSSDTPSDTEDSADNIDIDKKDKSFTLSE